MSSVISGIGDVVGGIVGGAQTPNVPNISVYQPQQPGVADKGAIDLIGQNVANNPAATYAPNFTSTYNNLYANPGAPGYMSAAGGASGIAGNAAQQSAANSRIISGMVPTAVAYGDQVAQMGLDPQEALYNRTLQRLQDQVRVSQAARGITMSPYGANLENEALGNFNIDWQNNALDRAIKGVNAYGTAANTAGSAASTASDLNNNAVIQAMKSGSIPYDAYRTIYGDQFGDTANLVAALTGQNSVREQGIADYMKYLGLSNNASGTAADVAFRTYDAQKQAAADAGMGISDLFGLAGDGYDALGGSVGGGSGALLPWLSGSSEALPWLAML